MAAQGMMDIQQALRDVCKRPRALEHLGANFELRATIRALAWSVSEVGNTERCWRVL